MGKDGVFKANVCLSREGRVEFGEELRRDKELAR